MNPTIFQPKQHQARSFSLLLFLLIVNIANSQYLYKGEVIDDETNEPLGFAALSKVGANNGTISNDDGRFTFKSSECPLEIAVSYMGYKIKYFEFNCDDANDFFQIRMEKTSFEVADVTIYQNDFIAK
ncbi:carboxypeptidase-like regulatory domain-containing protein, partial [Candidatus Venteria ishoeyi]|uniref:carboxypeptidase-like regulatory domain-containing protein n=1 Tax=Candidatus Venteria ishoeyi TaxID=1899563 RepID=UPI0011AFDE8F